jgi:2,3-bisphosphoglycerate-independent phosphoglycerate mutase
MFKPVVLVVLDGWGIGKNKKGNALFSAKLPIFEKLNNFYPCVALQASGISVGLFWGESGNSEVGHKILGAGKIIYQDLARITMDIQSGIFFKNTSLLKAIDYAKRNNSALHLMGLLSSGCIHSYTDHLYALLEMAKNEKLEKVFIHIFTDGRDSAPNSAIEAVRKLQEKIKQLGVGKIATIIGRNFSMDRNNNWERVEKAYNLLTKGEGEKIQDPLAYLQKSYDKDIFDEYLEPVVIAETDGALHTIQNGDSIIFFNIREDRARELTKAFVLPSFDKFPREYLANLCFTSLIKYEDDLPVNVAYEAEEVKTPLGKVLSQNNLKQLRIAETEKFAHVTYFFNGGNEEAFPKEDRIIIPSLKVSNFEEVPQMKAKELTEKTIEAIGKKLYAFILINYANTDIIGHTGNEKATIKSAETVDEFLGKLITSVLRQKGCLLITADHGNAEEMIDSFTGEKKTEHTTNPVPCWLVTPENHQKRKSPKNEEMKVSGLLSDVAPTILDLLQLDKPEEMSGESLLPILK